jgi:membrane-bound serine protease (ClpP class)
MRPTATSLTPLTAIAAWLVTASIADAASVALASVQAGDILLPLLRMALLAGLVFATVASFKLPGTGIAETVVLTLLAALLVPAIVSGTGQWYEVLGIVAGIGLLAIEVFVIPGFGATGVAGLVLVFVSFILLFLPDLRIPGAMTVPNVRNALLVFLGGTTGGVVSVGLLGHLLPKIPRANRLILNETNAGPMPERAGPVVGDYAVALTDLKPGGTARIAVDESGASFRDVNVVCDRGFIAAGSKLVIVDVEGTQVVVRPFTT